MFSFFVPTFHLPITQFLQPGTVREAMPRGCNKMTPVPRKTVKASPFISKNFVSLRRNTENNHADRVQRHSHACSVKANEDPDADSGSPLVPHERGGKDICAATTYTTSRERKFIGMTQTVFLQIRKRPLQRQTP